MKLTVNILFLIIGTVFGVYYWGQNPDGTLLNDNTAIIFAIIFGFSTTMMVMVANWDIPEANRYNTEQVIGILSAVTIDIRLLIYSSLFMVIASTLPLNNLWWNSLLFGVAAMVIPLTHFAVRDLNNMRNIRSRFHRNALIDEQKKQKLDKTNRELNKAIQNQNKQGHMETVTPKVSPA